MNKYPNKLVVKNLILSYGIHIALRVLIREQKNENYENCKVLYDCLKEINDLFDLGINLSLDRKLLKLEFEKLCNKMPNTFKNNAPHYVNEFLHKLNSKND